MTARDPRNENPPPDYPRGEEGRARRRQRGRRGSGTFDSRTAFEREFCANYFRMWSAPYARDADGRYTFVTMQLSWEAWRAREKLGFRSEAYSSSYLAEIRKLIIESVIKKSAAICESVSTNPMTPIDCRDAIIAMGQTMVSPALGENFDDVFGNAQSEFRDQSTPFPTGLALLREALMFGQFSDDFDQPLAKPLRKAIRDLIDNHPVTNIKVTQGAAAVDHSQSFMPMRGDNPCPIAVKVLLLNPGNVAVLGTWNGRDEWPKGWAPLPKIAKDMR